MGIEHVFVVYDSAKPTNRFDLGFRKAVTKIELVHFETFSEQVLDFNTHRANAAAAATAAADALAASQAAAAAAAAQRAADAAALQVAADADAAAAALRPAIQTFTVSHGTDDNVTALTVDIGTTVSFTCQFTNGYGEILLNGAAVTRVGISTTVNVDALATNSYTLRVTALNGTTATSSPIVIQTTVPSPVINSFTGGTMTQYVGHVTLVPNFSNGQGWLQQHAIGAFPNWSNTYDVVLSGQSIVVSPSASVDYTLKVTSNHSTSDHGPLSVEKTVTVAVTPDALTHTLTIAGGATHQFNYRTPGTFNLVWSAGADHGGFSAYEFAFAMPTGQDGQWLVSSGAYTAFPVYTYGTTTYRRHSLPAAPTYSQTFTISSLQAMSNNRWHDSYSNHSDYVLYVDLHLYGILTDGLTRSPSLASVRINVTAS